MSKKGRGRIKKNIPTPFKEVWERVISKSRAGVEYVKYKSRVVKEKKVTNVTLEDI